MMIIVNDDNDDDVDDGISIMLKEWKIVSFIDIVFKLFVTSSSAILLHCYFTLYYIIKYCGMFIVFDSS